MRTAIALIFYSLSNFFKKTSRALYAVAMASAPEPLLKKMWIKYWDECNYYKDVGHIHKGLSDWESELFERFALDCSPDRFRVSVLGCSTGREVLALAKKGYRVEGVDPSLTSIKIASSQVLKEFPDVRLQNQDMQNMEFETSAYDLIFLTGFIYGYVMSREERILLLRKMKSALSEKGTIGIVYHPFYRDQGQQRFNRLVGFLSQNFFKTKRPAQPNDLYSSEFGYIHQFTESELTQELAEAGYSVVLSRDCREDGAVLFARSAETKNV